MSKGIRFPKLNGSALKIGVVRARWNGEMTEALREQGMKALLDSGVKKKNIISFEVPGSYELVFGAKVLIEKHAVDAVLCLGTLIKGGTMHFEYIAEAVSQGIMNLSLQSGVPVIFGVLTCLTEGQARARSIGTESHGYQWGLSAVEMGLLKSRKR